MNDKYFLDTNLIVYLFDTIETSKKAIEIKHRYQYSYWDSLIIASALESNCSILYSEDMHHGQVIEGRLTIQNPLKNDV